MNLTVNLTQGHEAIELRLPEGRSIILPPDEKGMAALFRILQARALAEANTPTFNTPAAPLQSTVDEWLRKGGKVRRFTEQGKEEIDWDALPELTLDDILAATEKTDG